MLCNRSIASAKTHVANLTFAKVFEHAVSPVAVRIPVFKSLFACDDDHHRVLRGRYDPSLLLAAKARMNVGPSIVNAANSKPQATCRLPILSECTFGHSVFAPPALREQRHRDLARCSIACASAAVFVVLVYRRGGILYDAADTAPSARPAAHAATANCDNVVETESSLEC
jgi:hypothetical protein